MESIYLQPPFIPPIGFIGGFGLPLPFPVMLSPPFYLLYGSMPLYNGPNCFQLGVGGLTRVNPVGAGGK